jgi:hypothetical protein
VHSLNVPILCLVFSIVSKHVAEFLILITNIYFVLLTERITVIQLRLVTAWSKACELKVVQEKSLQCLYFGFFVSNSNTNNYLTALLIVPTTTEGFSMSWVEIIYFLNIKIFILYHKPSCRHCIHLEIILKFVADKI